MKSILVWLSLCVLVVLLLASCGGRATDKQVLPPPSVTAGHGSGCPHAMRHPQWLERVRRVQDGLIVREVGIDDIHNFMTVLNARPPVTTYRDPDLLLFVTLTRADDTGVLYLIYSGCVEGRVRMRWIIFDAMLRGY